MPLAETAYAKINLALHVRRRREDGYHELETLFAFVDDGDRLSISPAAGLTLEIIGPFAGKLDTHDDNLVLRAAALLRARNQIAAGAAFVLDKRLPVASGIGGGSADAAAAMRLAAALWGIGMDAVRPMDIAAELGADVPACVVSKSCIGTGVGDRLDFIDGSALSGLPILLVNPRVACPTGPVFRRWDGIDRGPLDIANWVGARNDLEAPAVSICPAIGEVLTALRAGQPRLARMSGSGATCFALFDYGNQRDREAKRLAAEHPDWWQMPGALR